MKYVVDSIHKNKVKLENINTGEYIYVSKDDINGNIKDADVLIYKNGKYNLSKRATNIRLKTVMKKYVQIKENKDWK